MTSVFNQLKLAQMIFHAVQRRKGVDQVFTSRSGTDLCIMVEADDGNIYDVRVTQRPKAPS